MHTNIKLLLITIFSIAAIPGFSQNAGIGTTQPGARLEVASSAADSVALKITHQGATKLKVAANGGTSIGTASNPPANGLQVAGKIIPGDSITSSRTIHIASVNDSVVLYAGGTTITLTPNGAVMIKATGNSGITIDGGQGNVNIKGTNVNIESQISTIIKGSTTTLEGISTTVQGVAQTRIIGSQVQIGSGGGGFPAARVGSQVAVNGPIGSIINGSSTVFIQ